MTTRYPAAGTGRARERVPPEEPTRGDRPHAARRLSDQYGPFEGRAWLDAAFQGPLPRPAAAAALRAVEAKVAPALMDEAEFSALPRRLRSALGRLIGAPADQVVLGNSTSYGLHLLANGIRWRSGDEVLVPEGEFPASALPWRGLASRGVALRRFLPASTPLHPDELRERLSPRTRVVCLSWVSSFSGAVADLAAIGAACREQGALCVVNGAQGVGALPLDVSRLAIDALSSCGWKWLCGPYATGFCWIRPALLERLRYNHAHWRCYQAAQPLDRIAIPEEHRPPATGRYDVFAAANFFNFAPWAAAVEHLLDTGVPAIARHGADLAARLAVGLEAEGYDLFGPEPRRSAIVVASHRDPVRNGEVLERLRAAGVDCSLRNGRLRFSPHLYNDSADIDRALDALIG